MQYSPVLTANRLARLKREAPGCGSSHVLGTTRANSEQRTCGRVDAFLLNAQVDAIGGVIVAESVWGRRGGTHHATMFAADLQRQLTD